MVRIQFCKGQGLQKGDWPDMASCDYRIVKALTAADGDVYNRKKMQN